MFKPFTGRVQFEPLKQESIIANDRDSLVESGKVIAVGNNIDANFPVKEGDTIYFLAHWAEEAKDVEGNSYWTVAWNEKAIMGYEHV